MFSAFDFGGHLKAETVKVVRAELPAVRALLLDTTHPALAAEHLNGVIARRRAKPRPCVSDNGTEPTGRAILKWRSAGTAHGRYIQTGKPQQNAFVDRCIGRRRDELSNETPVSTLGTARALLAIWRDDDDRVRPHSALAEKTPEQVREHQRRLATTGRLQDFNPGFSR